MGTVEYTKGLEEAGYDKFLNEYTQLFDDSFVLSMFQRRKAGKGFTPKMIEVLNRMITEEWLGFSIEESRKEAIDEILRKVLPPSNKREAEFIQSIRQWTSRMTSPQVSYLRRVASNQPSNMAIQGPLQLLGDIEDGIIPPPHPNCRCVDVPESPAKAEAGKVPARTSTPRYEVTDEDMRELEEFDEELRRGINLTGRGREIMGRDPSNGKGGRHE